MITVVTPYSVLPGKLDELVRILQPIGDALISEQPGYLGGTVLLEPGSESAVLTLNYYATEADAKAGPTSDTVRVIFQELADLVDVEEAMSKRKIYTTLHKIEE